MSDIPSDPGMEAPEFTQLPFNFFGVPVITENGCGISTLEELSMFKDEIIEAMKKVQLRNCVVQDLWIFKHGVLAMTSAKLGGLSSSSFVKFKRGIA